MFKSSYKIATIWGIPIYAHFSHMLIILVICIEIAPSIHPGTPKYLTLLTGLLLSALFFVSILLHELGHSFVAIKKGCRVRSITMGVWGGVASMENIPSKPKDEFLMAAAGPLVSLFLGGASIGLELALFLSGNLILIYLGGIFGAIGLINIILVIFNIIPAFPMDGGRILRALLVPKNGRVKATFIASRIGKTLAVPFGLWGLSAFFIGKEPWALMRVVIAILVYTMAEKEYQMVKMQEAAKWFRFGEDTDNQKEPGDQAEIGPALYDDSPPTTADVSSIDKQQ